MLFSWSNVMSWFPDSVTVPISRLQIRTKQVDILLYIDAQYGWSFFLFPTDHGLYQNMKVIWWVWFSLSNNYSSKTDFLTNLVTQWEALILILFAVDKFISDPRFSCATRVWRATGVALNDWIHKKAYWKHLPLGNLAVGPHERLIQNVSTSVRQILDCTRFGPLWYPSAS